MTRTVVWFSCGAASAVAAKLTASDTPGAILAYTDPKSEHPDNARFRRDVEQWVGLPVEVLSSEKYVDTWDVWEKRRFLNGPAGALCTVELKKKLRHQFQRPDDIQVFGYTAEEQDRADRFRQLNPEVDLRTPLIEYGLTKDDCLAMVDRAGIALPAMYLLGYRNNNCIGCPKGGLGYWNKIRRDFPDIFNRMGALERTLGHTCSRDDNGPVYLDELDPTRGNHADEPSFECSLLCAIAEQDIA
jgi:3'-phosphoadenosine 5'-phosphosulfate sulfotransferase (PAPS reductase)/FAD synthetase